MSVADHPSLTVQTIVVTADWEVVSALVEQSADLRERDGAEPILAGVRFRAAHFAMGIIHAALEQDLDADRLGWDPIALALDASIRAGTTMPVG